jgi:DNA (cytosine-5)-methyltransferase 1
MPYRFLCVGRDGGSTAELSSDIAVALRSSQGGGDKPYCLQHTCVRRLMPVECERLQGLEDGFTLVPWKRKPGAACPDGPRYKACGNAMPRNVMDWIGARLERALCTDAFTHGNAAANVIPEIINEIARPV